MRACVCVCVISTSIDVLCDVSIFYIYYEYVKVEVGQIHWSDGGCVGGILSHCLLCLYSSTSSKLSCLMSHATLCNAFPPLPSSCCSPLCYCSEVKHLCIRL